MVGSYANDDQSAPPLDVTCPSHRRIVPPCTRDGGVRQHGVDVQTVVVCAWGMAWWACCHTAASASATLSAHQRCLRRPAVVVVRDSHRVVVPQSFAPRQVSQGAFVELCVRHVSTNRHASIIDHHHQHRTGVTRSCTAAIAPVVAETTLPAQHAQ